MASDHPIQYFTGVERGPMNEYFVPDAAQTITFGELVFQAADEEIEECGADPASILGIAKGNSADKFLWEGRIPVSVLTSDVLIGLCVGAGTLDSTHANTSVGVLKLASGNWSADLADAVNTRFHITKVDVTNQIAWGYFLAANLQHDAVAS